VTDVVWALTIQWYAGNFACKLIKFLQLFGLYLSTYTVVVATTTTTTTTTTTVTTAVASTTTTTTTTADAAAAATTTLLLLLLLLPPPGYYYTVVVIAVDRCFAVVDPLSLRTTAGHRTRILVALSWQLSAIFSTPQV